MEDNIRTRLIKYLKYKGISQYKFQKEINATNGFVHNIGKSIGSTYTTRIHSSYPDLNMEWLILGNGEMLVDQNAQTPVDNSQNGGNLIENSNTGDVMQVTAGSSHSEANQLLRQILSMKDEIARIKSQIFKARLCPTHEECLKKLDEIIAES